MKVVRKLDGDLLLGRRMMRMLFGGYRVVRHGQHMLFFKMLHLLFDNRHRRTSVGVLVPAGFEHRSNAGRQLIRLGSCPATANEIAVHFACPACKGLFEHKNFITDHCPGVNIGGYIVDLVTGDFWSHVSERSLQVEGEL